MPKPLHETAVITEAAAAEAKKTGRMLVQHISPGWGSSGYYSTEVLEQAVSDQIIPAGTHMYADHPTEAEARERPVRSIKDLMSVTLEDARLATEADVARGADLGALVSVVDVVPTYRDLVEHLKDTIGVSIRGDGELVAGEAEGRSGLLVESLAHVKSVDWVTRPGRGGKVLSLVESARATSRAIAHGVSEATVNDTRDALQNELRDAYGAEKTYVWIRDFDDSTVWFEVESGEDSGIYGQPYSDSDGVVALTGERVEVRIVTSYVPAARPDSTTATEESEEDTMSKIQIEESEHTRLVEEAGRVATLESERDTAIGERETSRRDLAAERARAAAVTHARKRVTEANAALPGATVDRIVASATTTVPLTEAGALDTAALDAAVDSARTSEETYLAGLAEAAGVGSIGGFGGSPGGGGDAVTWDDIDKISEEN